jgi:hypothetical protein
MKNNEELLNALKVFIECWEDTNQADIDEDDAELALINEQLSEMMQRHGFEDQSTGGGCWGWFKNLLPDGSMYLQVTVGDSQLTYDALSDVFQQQICACVYIDNEWQEHTVRYYTFEEFKTALKESK